MRLSGCLWQRLPNGYFAACLTVLTCYGTGAQAAKAPPIVGLTAEFSIPGNLTAQAVKKSVQPAIQEITCAIDREASDRRDLSVALFDTKGNPQALAKH